MQHHKHWFHKDIPYLVMWKLPENLVLMDQTWGELIINANALVMHSFFPVIQDYD